MTWAELHAPMSGDLIYLRDPDTGEVFTERMFTVEENEGATPAERLAPSMPWATYWTVWARCDGGCGTGDCTGQPTAHCFLLSAEDFVPVSRLPEFEVQR
jgi:hypothetical protein